MPGFLKWAQGLELSSQGTMLPRNHGEQRAKWNNIKQNARVQIKERLSLAVRLDLRMASWESWRLCRQRVFFVFSCSPFPTANQVASEVGHDSWWCECVFIPVYLLLVSTL